MCGCTEGADCIEMIAAGGMLIAETEDCCSCCRCSTKYFALCFLFLDVALEVINLVLEGMAVHKCWVTETVQVGGNWTNYTVQVPYNYTVGNFTWTGNYSRDVFQREPVEEIAVSSEYGLPVWLASYIVRTALVVPLKFWLLPHTCKGPTCWQDCRQCENGYTNNPHCCMYRINQWETRSYKECMITCTLSFVLFHNLLDVMNCIGKFYFVNESRANEIVYGETNANVANGVELAADILGFVLMWLTFFSRLPCNQNPPTCCPHFENCCDFFISVLKFLTFIASATSLFFSFVCPLLLDWYDLDIHHGVIGGAYGGWLGAVFLLAFFCLHAKTSEVSSS